MNKTAILCGINYTFIEMLPLVGGDSVVVCQSDTGERFACPSELWKKSAHHNNLDAAVSFRSSSENKIKLFRSLFRGRDDVYARRWENQRTGKSGYSPMCKNEWQQGLCDKRGIPCSRCVNRELLPLTDTVVYRHLEGRDKYSRDVIGIYPLLPDETVCFLAADFDGEGWKEDISAFLSACWKFDLVPSVERSRSGNGGHAWLFFDSPVSAADARKLGSGLLTHAMECRPELKLSSYDRLFPNQDTLPKGGFGNLIALPLQGMARKAGNSVFIDESFQPYPDQWAYLSGIERITTERLTNLLNAVCRNGELGELMAAEQDEQKPWEHAKQTKLTVMDFPPNVELTLADGLYVRRDGISAKTQNIIKRLAAFRNPDFYKSQAMRLPTYNKPRVIDTAELLPDYIHLPRGCLDSLIEMLPGYTIDDKRMLPADKMESRGTLKLLDFAIPFVDLFSKGGVFVIDEFDSAIHPELVKGIIALFNDPEVNKACAQIVFTTHNPIYLNNKMFRRDQILFVEKDHDSYRSTMYSLADFGAADVRNDQNYLINYFKGKYGALPYIDFSELIESAAKERSL